jgi:hypothetical protein
LSLLEPNLDPIVESHLSRWFLFGGLAGVVIGGLLFIPFLFNALGDSVFVIFPSSIAGIADPRTTEDIALLLVIEFTSQFFLYGVIGFALGVCSYGIRKLDLRQSLKFK